MILNFFKKRCAYCGQIIKGEDYIKKEVSLYGNLVSKYFCCENHLDLFKRETKKIKKGGGCCH